MTMKQTVRCAVYTRKSTEEGLEQDFNSLDAQREACLSYIASQKSEGWVALPGRYDDGGYSGGTLDRPALKLLMADIEALKVDVVVVYKIDRLSRSLMDFARLVDVFDRKSVTFVSVTQSFNTTTSMGRLTLNVLLSFAQFEREVTGERIRDKFAASKKKGMWMGGPPPLGYDVANRKLVVNEAEAQTVRDIFQRYLDLGCTRLLCDDLRTCGVTSKKRQSGKGRLYGGKPIGRSAVTLILNNQTYIGQVTHKGHSYKGEHAAIVPRPLFDAVQRQLGDLAPPLSATTRSTQEAPLVGRVFDETGTAMLPTYTIKGGNRRYRYYASRQTLHGEKSTAEIQRVPAAPFEALIRDTLQRLGVPHDAGDPFIAIRRVDVLPRSLRLVLDRARVLAAWRATEGVLPSWPDRHLLAAHQETLRPGEALSEERDVLVLVLPVRAKFRGGAAGFHAPAGSGTGATDPTLLKALARAWRWREMLASGAATSVDQLATRFDLDRGHVGKTLTLAFLSPSIVRGILRGQYPGLRLSHLLNKDLPLGWSDQAALLANLPTMAPAPPN